MKSNKYQNFLQWVIYQIYPRSFLDTNGDGIGDLNGITQKLDYLKDLGVTALWLCPCYKSPNDDNGYDISDYQSIMPEFGTMDDMRHLIKEIHNRNMKLIMDLVPNHTSTEHHWFQESRKERNNPYSDYYYWFDNIPNNWQSAFGGSAWAYDEIRGQYYLHSYAVSQADLNWNNPAVVKAMQNVVDFWVDMGVDGFRVDVIDQISKDFVNNRNCFGPRLHKFIHALFGREKTKALFTVGECWVNDIEEMRRHCAASRNELSTLFQFDHMECGRSDKFTPKPDSLKRVRDILIHWQQETEKNNLLYSLFTDNHDQPPFVSRVANDQELRYFSATCLAAMFYLLKGIPFIYQGQEIGIASPSYDKIECFKDIESLNAYQAFCQTMDEKSALDKVNFGSRDNARRPMCWSEEGGFTSGIPWIAPHSRQMEINLSADLRSDKSVYRFYQQLLKLRRENRALLQGKFTVISHKDDDYFAYLRSYEHDTWFIVCNFANEQEITLPFPCTSVQLSNTERSTMNGIYVPYECAVGQIKRY